MYSSSAHRLRWLETKCAAPYWRHPFLNQFTREAFMLTKRVRRLLGVAAVAPLLLTGCDSSINDPFDDVAGTYDLTVFDGAPVPAVFPCGPPECPSGGTFLVNNGTLTLYDDGTFTERNHFTFRPNGASTYNNSFVSAGTYTSSGDDLTLSAPAQSGIGSRLIFATLSFETISYEENDAFYEYSR